MHLIATRQAQLETSRQFVEEKVLLRTGELKSSEERATFEEAPLNAVLGFAELLKMDDLSSDQARSRRRKSGFQPEPSSGHPARRKEHQIVPGAAWKAVRQIRLEA